MQVSPNATRHTESSAASLRIRTANTPADWQIAHGLLDDEQLLGAAREAETGCASSSSRMTKSCRAHLVRRRVASP
jgi:hypothetical protein